MTTKKNLTQEFVSEITQGLINQNNKWFEERKQALKEFNENYNGLTSYIYTLKDDRDRHWAMCYLRAMKKCFDKM